MSEFGDSDSPGKYCTPIVGCWSRSDRYCKRSGTDRCNLYRGCPESVAQPRIPAARGQYSHRGAVLTVASHTVMLPAGSARELSLTPLRYSRQTEQRRIDRHRGVTVIQGNESENCLTKIARGDAAAVGECQSQYGGLVWSLARRFCHSASDAEDAVQDIFIDIWKSAPRFDPSLASETTFVAMIARRRLIDRNRKLAREPHTDSLDETQHGIRTSGSSELEAHAESDRVAAVMAKLPPQTQTIIRMSAWLGMSHAAIAQKLGLPLGTVKSQLRRGLLRVREILGNPEPESQS